MHGTCIKKIQQKYLMHHISVVKFYVLLTAHLDIIV